MRELLESGDLNEEQYNAVVDTADEILCLACAGSGKSRTLAYRIARLIREGNPPESIVAFTFTEKAAESIKRRVAGALERCNLPVALVGAMYIGTIHSYCQYLLGECDAKYRQFEVLDENGLKLFLVSRYMDLSLHEVRRARAGSGYFETISEISNAWKIANDELLDFDAIEAQDPQLGRSLNNIYERLNHDEYIDFSLMIRLVVESLQRDTPEINRALTHVRHLMVDEYQDVNPSQEALISGIYSKIDTLFVVGDDDQSIYGWRGADVRNIIEFNQRYPDCSPHTLSTNFRSTETIVNVANRFIQLELGPSRIDKTPVSSSNGNINQVGNLWFETRADEAQWVARQIASLIGTKYIDGGQERGLTRSDFAILMRSVQGGTMNGGAPYHRDFTNALNERDIRYVIESEGSIFERDHAGVLRASMEVLREPGPTRTTVVNFFNNEVLPVYPNAGLNRFVEVVTDWNNQIHRPPGGARRKVYPQKLVHDLIEAFNVSATQFEDPEQVMRDLGVFSTIILDVEKVFISIDTSQRYQAILNFLNNVAESGYDTTQVELTSRPNAVTISTVHKMKGLEFPVVFIVDVVQQRFPGRRQSYRGWLPHALIQGALRRGLYQTDNPGEARLFYTALTRAERFLYVTGGAVHPELARPKQPSAFKLRIQNLQNPQVSTDPDVLPEGRETADERMRIEEDAMPTNFTEIKDYLECPMRYKFRKIWGFSPAVPELFGFGLTTHTAINKLHQEFPNASPTQAEAQAVAEEVFHLKHVFEATRPGGEGPYERARTASSRIVGEYAQSYPNDFLQTRSLEQRFEIKADPALITGSIDLLLRQDERGNIIDAKVIDFKSMDYPEENRNAGFWINLSLQVQLYAHAARIVLGENARTGAVHLLKERNSPESPNRMEVPVTDAAVSAAIQNIQWAVNKILRNEFPMRPSASKCSECDFTKICAKRRENFDGGAQPPEIHVPEIGGIRSIMVKAFSDVN